MSTAHPLLILAQEVGAKPVADLLAESLARVLDTPAGEEKFISYLYRQAAERRGRRAPRRAALVALTKVRRAGGGAADEP